MQYKCNRRPGSWHTGKESCSSAEWWIRDSYLKYTSFATNLFTIYPHYSVSVGITYVNMASSRQADLLSICAQLDKSNAGQSFQHNKAEVIWNDWFCCSWNCMEVLVLYFLSTLHHSACCLDVRYLTSTFTTEFQCHTWQDTSLVSYLTGN